MTKVLVFPCGSEIGLEIHKSLRYVKDIELYGGSSVSDHGGYVYSKIIEGIPFIKDDSFIDNINEVIVKYNIDYIIPAHDDAVLKLAENIAKLKCSYVGSDAFTARICRSKKKTYEYFKEIINIPKIYDENEISDKSFPLFLKPDVGQGSKGCFLAKNNKDLEFYKTKDKTLLVLEYLPGDEYTIDCFTDESGYLLFLGPRKRNRILNGISANTFPVSDSSFREIGERINANLNLRGAWFFQLKKRKDSSLVLLEIAPRIAGTMGMYRNLGINFPLLSILDKTEDIEVIVNKLPIVLDRCFHNKFKVDFYYKHVYIDYDDTLIIKNKVNLLLISLIYQFINENKKIYLITKHSGDLNKSLLKFKISENLFDEIYHLSENDAKSDFIDYKESIFIDDSYRERKEISIKKEIPVFSIDMLESLVNYRD